MPDLHSLALFMAAGLALNLTPGPDMLYVAARGAAEGRAAGVASALGIAAGTLVHIALVSAGLAALLAAVPVAYTVVRLGGAAYLVYLGLRSLLRPGGVSERALAPASRWRVFRQGVVTNVLNPKVALFFLAFLPQFVDPDRSPAWVQMLLLGPLVPLMAVPFFGLVILGASRAKARLGRIGAGASRWVEGAAGALFVALGLRLVVQVATASR